MSRSDTKPATPSTITETHPLPPGLALGDAALRTVLATEMLAAIDDFDLEVNGIANFVEFMDEHGDRHLSQIADMSRPLLRRCVGYAGRLRNLALEIQRAA